MPDQEEILDHRSLSSVDDMLPVTTLVPADPQPSLPIFTTSLPELSKNDIKAGKDFCKRAVESIVKLKLPETISKRKELQDIVALQMRFEQFTLESMFTIVANAMKLMENIQIDDVYTTDGLMDPFKLQSIIALQQHAMNTVSQFSLQLRQLPSAISNIIKDVEYSQVIVLTEEANKQISDSAGGNTTTTPLAIMLRNAEKEMRESDNAVHDVESEDIKADEGIPVDEAIIAEAETIDASDLDMPD